MRNLWIFCLLLAIVAWGQVNPAVPAKPESAGNKTEQASQRSPELPPDAPVIIIKGFCGKAGTASADASCQTVITRAQVDLMANSIQPYMPEGVKRQLVESYPKLLVMAALAEKRGLDKGPRFEERLRFDRIQILEQELVRQIQIDSGNVSEKEIEAYYQAHTGDFDQAVLERIFVPLSKQLEPPTEKLTEEAANARTAAAESAMATEATALRARAAAGESFEGLQKEAYAAANITTGVPSTELGKMRRRVLPQRHASVFDLKPGEVSAVISDPAGHYIYKVVSKEGKTLEQAHQEIREIVQNQHLQNSMEAIEDSFSSEINQAYFSGGRRKTD